MKYTWPVPCDPDQPITHELTSDQVTELSKHCLRALHCFAATTCWPTVLERAGESVVGNLSFSYTLPRSVSAQIRRSTTFIASRLQFASKAHVTLTYRLDCHVHVRAKGTLHQIIILRKELLKLVRSGRVQGMGRVNTSAYYMAQSSYVYVRGAPSADSQIKFCEYLSSGFNKRHALVNRSSLKLQSGPAPEADWKEVFFASLISKIVEQAEGVKGKTDALETLRLSIHFGTFYLLSKEHTAAAVGSSVSIVHLENTLNALGNRNTSEKAPYAESAPGGFDSAINRRGDGEGEGEGDGEGEGEGEGARDKTRDSASEDGTDDSEARSVVGSDESEGEGEGDDHELDNVDTDLADLDGGGGGGVSVSDIDVDTTPDDGAEASDGGRDKGRSRSKGKKGGADDDATATRREKRKQRLTCSFWSGILSSSSSDSSRADEELDTNFIESTADAVFLGTGYCTATECDLVAGSFDARLRNDGVGEGYWKFEVVPSASYAAQVVTSSDLTKVEFVSERPLNWVSGTLISGTVGEVAQAAESQSLSTPAPESSGGGNSSSSSGNAEVAKDVDCSSNGDSSCNIKGVPDVRFKLTTCTPLTRDNKDHQQHLDAVVGNDDAVPLSKDADTGRYRLTAPKGLRKVHFARKVHKRLLYKMTTRLPETTSRDGSNGEGGGGEGDGGGGEEGGEGEGLPLELNVIAVVAMATHYDIDPESDDIGDGAPFADVSLEVDIAPLKDYLRDDAATRGRLDAWLRAVLDHAICISEQLPKFNRN